MNDPQRPIMIDGLWHFYYLYNADYPDGNGTEWYHVTSDDLVHWRDEGVAIKKYRNGLGDIETGSVVVDEHGTAGFGDGAVIAIVTQQHDGVQRQSLFVSEDGGFTFVDSGRNPVLDNPGTQHFRDPKVFWDETAGRWTMALAEGEKVGFYSSPDLKSWTYRSDFAREDLGLLECPDLFPLPLHTEGGEYGEQKWILLTGADGGRYGMAHGTAYWVGDWDGQTFTPDTDEPRWLDHGADFYAAVTWEDPRHSKTGSATERYALGWMNNWSYAGLLPTEAWHGGQDSVVRSIRLESTKDGPALISAPIDALADLEAGPIVESGREIRAGSRDTVVDQTPPGAYRVRATLEVTASEGIDELRLHIGNPDGAFATVGYDVGAGNAFLARDADAAADGMPEEYQEVRTAPVAPDEGAITLDVIVDAASIEAFANGGDATLSSLIYLEPEAPASLTLEALGEGIAVVTDFSVVPLENAPVERLR